MVLTSGMVGFAQVSSADLERLKENNRLYNALLEQPLQEETLTRMLEIEEAPNQFIPPVLYAYSNALFWQDRKKEALFWYYVAQLRTNLDVNLGKENLQDYRERVAGLYQDKFSPLMRNYARQNISMLEEITEEVVKFMEENEEAYDHGWIYYDGSGAFYDPEEIEKLFKNPQEFNAVKKQIIQEFYYHMLRQVAPNQLRKGK